MKYRIVEVKPSRWEVQRKRSFWFGWDTFGRVVRAYPRVVVPFDSLEGAKRCLTKLKAQDDHISKVVHTE